MSSQIGPTITIRFTGNSKENYDLVQQALSRHMPKWMPINKGDVIKFALDLAVAYLKEKEGHIEINPNPENW